MDIEGKLLCSNEHFSRREVLGWAGKIGLALVGSELLECVPNSNLEVVDPEREHFAQIEAPENLGQIKELVRRLYNGELAEEEVRYKLPAWLVFYTFAQIFNYPADGFTPEQEQVFQHIKEQIHWFNRTTKNPACRKWAAGCVRRASSSPSSVPSLYLKEKIFLPPNNGGKQDAYLTGILHEGIHLAGEYTPGTKPPLTVKDRLERILAFYYREGDVVPLNLAEEFTAGLGSVFFAEGLKPNKDGYNYFGVYPQTKRAIQIILDPPALPVAAGAGKDRHTELRSLLAELNQPPEQLVEQIMTAYAAEGYYGVCSLFSRWYFLQQQKQEGEREGFISQAKELVFGALLLRTMVYADDPAIGIYREARDQMLTMFSPSFR